MPSNTKNQLTQLIQNGNIGEAIQQLVKITIKNPQLHQQATQLSARYNRMKRGKIQGIHSFSDTQVEENKITQAALDLIFQLPPNADSTIPLDDIVYSSEEKDAAAATAGSGSNTGNLPLLVGLGLFFTGLIAIFFLPCPTDAQLFGIRLAMALGAAGIATIIPGMLKITAFKDMITAGGALAIAAMVYLFNPAAGLADTKGCQDAFNFTVRVEANAPSTQYPSLTNGKLELFIQNDWKDEPINAENLVDFKGISTDFNNQLVPVRLSAPYWKAKLDSLLLKANGSSVLQLIPDGSLGKVRGRVQDEEGNPVSDAKVDIGLPSRVATSDTEGYFSIDVPMKEQQKRYKLSVRKDNYTPYQYDIDPTQQHPVVLQKK